MIFGSSVITTLFFCYKLNVKEKIEIDKTLTPKNVGGRGLDGSRM